MGRGFLRMSLGCALLAAMLLKESSGLGNTPSDDTLQTFYATALINNPMSGLGDAANSSDIVPLFRDVEDVHVECNLYIEQLRIYDYNNTFDVSFWWHIRYNDKRTFPLIWTSETEGCHVLCSSDQSRVLNQNGTAACCSKIYVPNARWRNLAGSASKSFHTDIHILAENNTAEVNFWRRSSASFRGTLSYRGFPFKKQQLRMILLTDFIPYLSNVSFLEIPTSQGLPRYPRQIPAYDRNNLDLLGWEVLGLEAHTTGFRPKLNSKEMTDRTTLQPGVTYTLQVQRRTTAFYVYVMVLPICLLVFMAAFQCLVETGGLKSRMEYLGGIFFAMLFLQFGIREYQPAALLIPPYMVIIGGYVFMTLVAGGYVLADLLANAPQHVQMRREWLHGRMTFLKFLQEQNSRTVRLAPKLRRRESILAYLTRDGSWSGEKIKAAKQAGSRDEHSRLSKRLQALNSLSASRRRFSASGPCTWLKYWWLPTWWQLAKLPESQNHIAAIISAAEHIWMPLCIVGFYLFTTLIYLLSD